MARIPDYSQRQVGIRPASAPGFSMRGPDASGLARGMEQAENAVLRHVQKERDNANRAAILEAEKQLTDWQHNTLFNPQTGVYTRKGKNGLQPPHSVAIPPSGRCGAFLRLLQPQGG